MRSLSLAAASRRACQAVELQLPARLHNPVEVGVLGTEVGPNVLNADPLDGGIQQPKVDQVDERGGCSLGPLSALSVSGSTVSEVVVVVEVLVAVTVDGWTGHDYPASGY